MSEPVPERTRGRWSDFVGGRDAWLTDRRAIGISVVPLGALAILLAVGIGVTLIEAPDGALAGADAAASARANAQADAWLAANLDEGRTVWAEPSVAERLRGEGESGAEIVAITESSAPMPQAWRDVDVIVDTIGVADRGRISPAAAAAMDNSIVVASFGSGTGLVEIRRVTPEGRTLAAVTERTAAEERRRFGAELAQNPFLELSAADRGLLVSGAVDSRIAVVLGALSASGVVSVTGFPPLEGEETGVLRRVVLSAVDGVPLVNDAAVTPQMSGFLDGLGEDYAPDRVEIDGESLVLTFAALPAAASE